MRIPLIALVVCASVAHAQPDPCSWITPAQLTTELGGIQFRPATRTVATPAFSGQNAGTQCDFRGNGGTDVELTVYVDHSPSEAKSIFDQMKTYFPAASTPSGIGDDAYFDKSHGLHVLKGKTRFFLKVAMGGSGNGAQEEMHARNVAGMVLPKT